MKNKSILVGLLLAVSLTMATRACGPLTAAELKPFAERAASPNPRDSAIAITFLRSQGPVGLQALLDANATLLTQHNSGTVRPSSLAERAAWQRLQAALDAVGAQRDCQASRLYWYTNFDDAVTAAQAAHKPILSLRLLGNLNEEYSCANSRFFRTTLYANAEVSQYLRTHFILHWQSVRPVPRITIDFGNGRKIERTITGNSIHYILDSDGRAIDALPGLYGPKAFLKGLADAEQAALKYAALPSSAREEYLRNYHAALYAATLQSWNHDLAAIGQSAISSVNSLLQLNPQPPIAIAPGQLTASKSAAEIPMLKSFQTADDATWTQIARLHSADAELDPASVTLISAKYPTAKQAARMAYSKSAVENPLNSALRNLRSSIAEDTVRNEYQLHSQIHEWFMKGAVPNDLGRFNSLVYAKLFLTPDSDPWLGLVPPNTITALDNNGLVQASSDEHLP